MTFATFFTDTSIAEGTGMTASVSGTTTTVTLQTPVSEAHGGTGATSVTTAPTASAFAGWDANSNLSANNFIEGYQTIVTANATTTFTVATLNQTYFTGSGNQIISLPVVSTLVLGQSWLIVNQSSAAITVQSSGGAVLQVMASNTSLLVTCILLTGTGNKSWAWEYNFLDVPPSSLIGNATLSPATPEPITLVANQLAFNGTALGLAPQVPSVLANVTLADSNITAMFGAPFEILPALSSGFQYFIESVQLIFDNTNPFSGGG